MWTRANKRHGIVYIIRFHQPIGNPDNKDGLAQYYIGWTRSPRALRRRIRAHKEGRGAKITKEAARLKIGMELLVCFPGTREDERWAKAYKNTRRLVEREAWLRHWKPRVPF